MFGPKTYREQLEALGIDGMEIDVSTMEKAMETLNNLGDIENVLKKFRLNIRTDIRQLRKDYLKLMKEVEEAPQKNRRFGRKSDKNTKKKSLVKERNNKIGAYELVENMIDNYLEQIEDARIYIRKSIEKRVD
jgi:ribosomal protein S25